MGRRRKSSNHRDYKERVILFCMQRGSWREKKKISTDVREEYLPIRLSDVSQERPPFFKFNEDAEMKDTIEGFSFFPQPSLNKKRKVAAVC